LSRALVTGHLGQDGWYLAELLRAKGYDVVGLGRGDVDVLDQHALADVLREHMPREVYNLASPSFVPRSWEHPVETAEFAAVGVTSLLEAVRVVNPKIRLYQASSSEIFGEPVEVPQTERTPLAPVTPYGVAKAYGHFILNSYRRRYGLHASGGILYNHESPRRPLDFLPSKVAHAAANIAAGVQSELVLGDLDAQRDWGYAGDYVEAMWLMLQQDEPGDYVIATGRTHTVRDCVQIAFDEAGVDDWERYITIDPAFLRPAEVDQLIGDPAKAKELLGWEPKTSFEELIRLMTRADLELLKP
jgi:GDPmannose 4,6-dehydratase